MTGIGEGILDTRRLLFEVTPRDKPVPLQFPEVLRKHFLRDTRHISQ
jgi:hypothetical protein